MNAAQNAWNWVVHLRRRGQLHSRHFANPQYGGNKKALAAALAWRDKIAGGALFFKQWGGERKEKFGRELNGRTYDAMPGRRVIQIHTAA